MLKLLKKISWDKMKPSKKLRSANELFYSGKIFDAKDSELNNILKELTCSYDTDSKSVNKDVIRAITVLTAKNNKYTNLIQFFLIILTIFSLFLAWRQTDYAEIASRPIRIEQNTIIRRAADYCKQNPSTTNSGLSWEDGRSATCPEVLKSSQLKKLEL